MKKGLIAGLILIFIITAVGTVVFVSNTFVDKYLGAGNAIEVESKASEVLESSDNTITISKETYDELKAIKNRYNKVEVLRNFVEENYYKGTDEISFEDGLYKGIFEALEDPYSNYMNEAEFESFMEMNEGSYGGIGVVIAPGKSGYITVVSPIEDTPGERAGLEPGDEIIKVNASDYVADQIDEAITFMKGEPGTDVTITVRRDSREFDVVITREEIILKAVKSEMMDGKIGYIRITSFDNKVYSEFMEHLNELKAQKMTSLIIDLRNNPGGALDQCVKITDELLGDDIIVTTKTRSGETDVTRSDAAKLGLPLVVLVNGGSASASEILTGAVKDTENGTIVGTKTFGKGVVQIVRSMIDNTGFKLTISEYFTPNNINIHGIGIEPNIVIENDPESEVDLQLDKAIDLLTNK